MVTYKNKIKNCSYQVNYPVLKLKKKTSLYNEKIINGINETIKKTLLNLSVYDNEFDCNTKDQNAPEFTLYSTSEVKLLSERLYSVYVNESAYTAGNPHPNNLFKTFNFSIEDGTEISFKSLFKDNTFIEPFNKQLAKDLVKQSIITSDPVEFDSVKKEEYNFYLTDKYIYTINLFDVHAMASAEGKVSYDKMKKYLNTGLLLEKKK